MKIGCLQFCPQTGEVEQNAKRASTLLNDAKVEGLDLLVLPEFAFAGNGFKSLNEIRPFLEMTTGGNTAAWAIGTAVEYHCAVIGGYPEVTTDPWHEYYNSTIVVTKDGTKINNYRKSILCFNGAWEFDEHTDFFGKEIDGLGFVAMRLLTWPTRPSEKSTSGFHLTPNEKRFEVEFAKYILDKKPNLVILPTAWLTGTKELDSHSIEVPDNHTVQYWVGILATAFDKLKIEHEVLVVIANRTGVEGEVMYSGSSIVMGFQSGILNIYGHMGHGKEGLLVVDTSHPQMSYPNLERTTRIDNYEQPHPPQRPLSPKAQFESKPPRRSKSLFALDLAYMS